jgi:flagellar motility protein MotE (MotC chaperone)
MNINLMPDEDEKELLKLKDGMTEQQRSDMAEIIQNELKRREAISKKGAQSRLMSSKSALKPSRLSTNLSHEDLGDIYSSSDKNIQQLRVQSLEKRLQEAKREVMRLGAAGKSQAKKRKKESSSDTRVFPAMTNKLPAVVVVVLLLTLGVLRYSKGANPLEGMFSGYLPASNPSSRASLSTSDSRQISAESTYVGDQAVDAESDTGSKNRHLAFEASSPIERGILMQLDQRRVELEKRRKILDGKEKELLQQTQLVAEKVTELKSLISKLSALRKEKDHKYNARMEQLASVYSAMAPHESASLIGKLDNEVGLALLERMPGKRMAQILGVMDQNRALELTRHLTDKKKL